MCPAAAVLLVDTLGASKRAPSTPTSCAAARSRPRSWQTRCRRARRCWTRPCCGGGGARLPGPAAAPAQRRVAAAARRRRRGAPPGRAVRRQPGRVRGGGRAHAGCGAGRGGRVQRQRRQRPGQRQGGGGRARAPHGGHAARAGGAGGGRVPAAPAGVLRAADAPDCVRPRAARVQRALSDLFADRIGPLLAEPQ